MKWRSLISVCVGVAAARAAEKPFPVEIEATSLVREAENGRATVVRLRLARPLAAPGTVRVETKGGVRLFERSFGGARRYDEEAIRVDVPCLEGADTTPIEVVVVESDREARRSVLVPVPEGAWTLHFIPGFHYDPVWWNTQAHYTETGYRLGDSVGPGLTLVEEYLRKCREDADYTAALHQLPYLKTFVEARPHRYRALRQFIRDRRCAIVGGTYNELSSTLISAESTARNAIYGVLFQTGVLGGDGSVFWQCDVFGHDPSFPSLMKRSGHEAGAFARGPFHQWGAPREQVNFPSEFYWMAPDGESILTHYMTGHYGYAYGRLATGTNRGPEDFLRSERIVAEMFEDLKRPALTHHVMLPMHMDFIRPLEDLGDIVRRWNATYVSPRARISTPEAYFQAVRDEVQERGITVPVITRDMNPIYTGCGVSLADLKTANRACEVVLRDAEVFATLAALEGAEYPSLAIDRAWRQLLFNAHHDAITGSMSDQVYLDILYAYRDALEIATEVRDRAVAFLNDRVVPADSGVPYVIAWNSLATPRAVRGEDGWSRTLPAVGYASFAAPEDSPQARPGQPLLENEYLRVTIDVHRGGTIADLLDKRYGRSLLKGAGNDIVVLDEYETLPGHGEGPWHLSPTGERRGGTHVSARILAPDPARPYRVTVEARYTEFTKRQSYELLPGSRHLDMETQIIDWTGENKLLRAEFPIDLPGARPVFQTAAAVIGRPFARDVDAAHDPWTLDQTCWQWAELGTVCAIEVVDGDAVVHRRAIGVGEIVIEEGASSEIMEQANRLAEALVKSGVTTTTTGVDRRRYGDLQYDSNLPDFRVLLGRPDVLLTAMGINETVSGTAVALIDRDGAPPVLVIPNAAALEDVRDQLAGGHAVRVAREDARIDSPTVAPKYGVALVNRGPVSVHIASDGTMGLNLMRSSTGWPAGVWIDEPHRRLPDGAPFETMHGSHVFRYSLVPHAGDFRDAGLNRLAQRINHPPRWDRREAAAKPSDPEDALPATKSFVEIDDPGVLLLALKPVGFAEARWDISPATERTASPEEVVLRLWNGSGRATETTFRLSHFAGEAWLCDLMENPLAALPIVDGAIRISMQSNAVETVRCRVKSRHGRRGGSGLDPVNRQAAPSAYWLENLGEGVTGNGILSVAPDRRTVELVDGVATVILRIANNNVSRAVPVTLDVAASAKLDVSFGAQPGMIAPSGFVEVHLRVAARPGTRPGRSMIRITANGPYPWPVTATVWVQPADFERASRDVEIQPVASIVTSGGALRAEIKNNTDGPIAGEAAWLTPEALWSATPKWRRTVTIPPGGSEIVTMSLAGGLSSFALLRFTCGGQIAYGEPIAIVTDEEKVFMTTGVGRLRLHRGVVSEFTLSARSISGLSDDSRITVDAPVGWETRERARSFAKEHGIATLTLRYGVFVGSAEGHGTITATGQRGAVKRIEATVVPTQVALRAPADVSIDGGLGEWDPAEFTTVSDARGDVRCGVRYGPAGLVMAVEVFDDRFSQDSRGGAIWQGDSIQWGLTAVPSTDPGYHESIMEFGAALTRDGPEVWCWHAGPGGRTGRVDSAKVAVVVADGVTRYEVLLPASAIPSADLAAGNVLGFSYIANDNDGSGFEGAVQWTRGLSGGKDASLFGDLILARE